MISSSQPSISIVADGILLQCGGIHLFVVEKSLAWTVAADAREDGAFEEALGIYAAPILYIER